MAQPVAAAPRTTRTREAVLQAAEELFAERGFAATRLEDIAERVGIRRASIVYYFRDKRELYDAVLESVFGGLHAALAATLSRRQPLLERIDRGVQAWIDYVGGRPSTARFILREVAGAGATPNASVAAHVRPFQELIVREYFDAGSGAEHAKLARIDPVHVASTIAGATIFFVAAMPLLVPELGIEPTSREHLEAHKEEMLRIVHRLLGTNGT